MTPHAVVERLEPAVSEPSPRRSLPYKLAEVMAELHRIPKKGHNNFHNYDYVTEGDIVEAVRVELAKRHVMLIPAVLKQHREPVGEKGSVLTTLEMEFTFYDGESGEAITRPWIGAGTDKEDKGAYKGMTGATKYFLLKTFLLPTGDDPEQDDKATAKPKASRPVSTKAPSPASVDTRTGEVLDEPAADHYRIKRAWIDKSGTKNNRPWTLYAVETSAGDKFSTFDARIYETAQTCVDDGTPVEIVTETKRFGKEIVTFMPTRHVQESHEDDHTDPDMVPF